MRARKSRITTHRRLPIASVITVAAIGYSLAYFPNTVAYAEAPSASKSPVKKIRLSEVKEHGKDAETRWVIKGTKVYDITDWVPNHPGGEVILRAVGGVIDKYWDIFTIHKKPDVYDILETYLIGEVDERDLVNGCVPSDDIDDPFDKDPKRDPRLRVITDKPCNAETPEESLSNFITPDQTFYVRNHLWVPPADESGNSKITIELYDGEEVEYSISDLKSKFAQIEVTATLQCSGNRRKHMTEGSRSTNGLQWNTGAISTANWTGVRLRDILHDTGFPVNDPPDEVQHIQFQGSEAYGASIPIEKALSRKGDVLLVHSMNGKPLSPDHGFPLRVIVPGHVAARSVKWLSKITLSDEESHSQWQKRDYKCFGPNQGGNDIDWESAPAIQETPPQSAITSIRNISAHTPLDRLARQVYGLEEDSVVVEGYAFSGGGRGIVRVDVSADNGRTWTQAELLPDDAKGSKSWAWKRWRWVLPRRLAGRVFICKAVDEAYNTQPESYEPNYNFRGNLTNAWHRVPYRQRDD